MTTVSRQQTVTTSSMTGGGNLDHRLDRLLEDLKDTATPPENQQNVSEFREYRTYSSTKKNDEPAQISSEKWVEYGTQGGGGSGILQRLPALSDSAYSSSNNVTRERTVNFSDDVLTCPVWPNNSYSSATNNMSTQMDFRQPANAITTLKPGPSSPIGISTEPNVERKEFYAKASYTSLIKGSGGPGDVPPTGFNSIDTRSNQLLEDYNSRSSQEPVQDIPRPSGVTSSISETRRTQFSEKTSGTTGVPADYTPPAIGLPLYSSTPLKSTQSSYTTREVINDRSVTSPPPTSQGLKTPPLVRKILQSSTGSHQHLYSSNTSSTTKKTITDNYDSTQPICARPPLSSSQGIPNYDEPPQQTAARYYTSTTRTEHRENRELSPVRVFPSAQPPRDYYGGPPERLDDLMATFEDSYTETRRIHGDGGGPHQSHPYGPGTHPIQPVRQVRIDDSVTQRTITMDQEPDLHPRKNATNYQNPPYQPVEPTRNVAGPPVFYPSNQVFPKTEEEAAQEAGKGKMNAKRKADHKEKEKGKSSHDEGKGKGAIPIPICLPVCCAAPCTIM